MDTAQEMLTAEIRELLESKGHYIGYRIIHEIADLFDGYIETRSQVSAPLEISSQSEIDDLKCQHEKETRDFERIEYAYRQNVAKRNRVTPRQVYIEDGRVMFDGPTY